MRTEAFILGHPPIAITLLFKETYAKTEPSACHLQDGNSYLIDLLEICTHRFHFLWIAVDSTLNGKNAACGVDAIDLDRVVNLDVLFRSSLKDATTTGVSSSEGETAGSASCSIKR